MFVSEFQYCSILDVMPISCVDVIIQHESKILLIHRKKSEDMGDLWWIPGGRIHKNETFENAVKRKAVTETGLQVHVLKKCNSYEGFYESKKCDSGTHFITTVYITKPVKLTEIKIDHTADDYKWIDYHAEKENLHALLRKMIEENLYEL